MALVALDSLHALAVGLVGVVESNLQLVDLAFELLLDAEGFGLGVLLGFEGSGQGIHGTLVVLAAILKQNYLLFINNN